MGRDLRLESMSYRRSQSVELYIYSQLYGVQVVLPFKQIS